MPPPSRRASYAKVADVGWDRMGSVWAQSGHSEKKISWRDYTGATRERWLHADAQEKLLRLEGGTKQVCLLGPMKPFC